RDRLCRARLEDSGCSIGRCKGTIHHAVHVWLFRVRLDRNCPVDPLDSPQPRRLLPVSGSSPLDTNPTSTAKHCPPCRISHNRLEERNPPARSLRTRLQQYCDLGSVPGRYLPCAYHEAGTRLPSRIASDPNHRVRQTQIPLQSADGRLTMRSKPPH